MNNKELKKKIVEILEETEYEWTEEKNGYILQIFYDNLADALIAAGYGDVSEIRSLADNVMLSVIAHKAEVSSMEQRVKEAEHRAEVAERALREFAVNCGCDKCPFLGRCYISPDAEGDYQGCFNMYLSIAEKDLAEEEKE